METAGKRLSRLVLAVGIVLLISVTTTLAHATLVDIPIEQPGVAMSESVDGPDARPMTVSRVPTTYPAFSASIGVSAFLSTFSDFTQAFRKIEASYGAAGYPVPEASGVGSRPLVMPTLTMQINRWLGVSAQAGQTWTQDNDLRLIGGLVSGRYTLPAAHEVSFFTGVGGGVYGFKFSRDYGVRITPNDASGGYYTLDQVVLEGGGSFWTTAAGVRFQPDPEFALEGLVQYVGTGDVSTDTDQAGTVSVNMSGVMIGASLALFF